MKLTYSKLLKGFEAWWQSFANELVPFYTVEVAEEMTMEDFGVEVYLTLVSEEA